jgi:hypothetical protein
MERMSHLEKSTSCMKSLSRDDRLGFPRYDFDESFLLSAILAYDGQQTVPDRCDSACLLRLLHPSYCFYITEIPRGVTSYMFVY